MTVIGEHMFATGDDDGVVKSMLLFFSLLCFIESIIFIFKYFKCGIFDKERINLYFH